MKRFVPDNDARRDALIYCTDIQRSKHLDYMGPLVGHCDGGRKEENACCEVFGRVVKAGESFTWLFINTDICNLRAMSSCPSETAYASNERF
jgi:hypothetical protein